MTLVAASAPADLDLEGGAQAGVPRTHQGRPRIAPPGHTGRDVGVKLVDYTRASKLGKCLEDGWAIHRAEQRRILFGLSRAPGLYDRAQAVASLEDRAELDEIASLAAAMGGNEQEAFSGTALHTLTEREDAGEDLSYLGPRMAAAIETWRGFISHFTIHGSEQFVVNDALEAAGSYDRIVSPCGWMTAPDGTRIGPDDVLGVDLKSGRSAKYYGAVYKVQQGVYFGPESVPYTHEAGRGEWPDGRRPSSAWSLIVHVPVESPGELDLYWVDLAEGRALAERAVELRRLQRAKGLPPAELPDAGGGPSALDVVALIRAAGSVEVLRALWVEHGGESWLPFVRKVLDRRLVELGVAP